MKAMKWYLLALLLSLGTFAYAQRGGNEVVYLKNGSVLRGKVLEINMSGDLKLETKDGSVFVYKAHEVERIVHDIALTGKATDGYQEKKSYIGISGGLVYNGLEELLGGHLNLVDMGYLFDRHIGLSMRLGLHALPSIMHSTPPVGMDWSTTEKTPSIKIGYLMAGPLCSLPGINPKDRFELRPMIGFANVQIGAEELEGVKIGWEISAQYRRHLTSALDLLAGMSYFGVVHYNDITINIGVGLRLN